MYTIATTFSEASLYPVKMKGTEPDQRSVEKKKAFYRSSYPIVDILSALFNASKI